MDPKLGFWVDSKSHPKQRFSHIFNTLKLDFFSKLAKYHTLIKDMGSKNIPVTYFLSAENIPFILIFQFDPLNTARAVRASP